MVERKLFLPNQNVNIVYPNEVNVIVVPNSKNNGDYYENPFCLISQMNFDYMENDGKKDFLANPKH